MAGDAPLIRLNNGIEITGETKCYFDPRKIKKDAINCISHAHSDHLPKSFESNKAIASSVTLRCASERVKRTIEPDPSDRVETHDAGHIIGSQMFLLKDSQKEQIAGGLPHSLPNQICLLQGRLRWQSLFSPTQVRAVTWLIARPSRTRKRSNGCWKKMTPRSDISRYATS